MDVPARLTLSSPLLVTAQVSQSTLDLESVRSILSEYRIHNADVTLRCDATADDLIDVVEGNRLGTSISHYLLLLLIHLLILPSSVVHLSHSSGCTSLVFIY